MSTNLAHDLNCCPSWQKLQEPVITIIGNTTYIIRDRISLLTQWNYSARELLNYINNDNSPFWDSKNSLISQLSSWKPLPYIKDEIEKIEDLIWVLYLYNIHSITTIDIDELINKVTKWQLSDLQYFFEKKLSALIDTIDNYKEQAPSSIKEILELIWIINQILSYLVNEDINTSETNSFIDIFFDSNCKLSEHIKNSDMFQEVKKIYLWKLDELTKNSLVIKLFNPNYEECKTIWEIEILYIELLTNINNQSEYLNISDTEKSILLILNKSKKQSAVKNLKYKDERDKSNENNKKLLNEGRQDWLTGLYNRWFLDAKLTEIVINIKENTNLQYWCIMIDLDYFKKVNDTYWHIVWDKVLKHISWVIKNTLRKEDIVGRFWWEEFLVLVEISSANDLKKITNNLLIAIRKTSYFDWITIDLTVSIWATCINYHLDWENVEEATIKAADDLLYEAKNSWRDKALFYEPEKKSD